MPLLKSVQALPSHTIHIYDHYDVVELHVHVYTITHRVSRTHKHIYLTYVITFSYNYLYNYVYTCMCLTVDDSPIEDTSQSIDHTHSSPPSKSDTPTTSNIPTDQQQYQWPGQQYQEYPQQYRVGGYAPPVQHPYPPYTQPPYGQYYGGYYYPQQGYYPPNASPHPNAPPTQERWGQQQYPISPSQQRIVRSEPIATPTTSNPPPPVGHEPNWNQPQYPQWEGKRGGVSSPKGRGRGRGRRISSPAHQSKWGSNEGILSI